MLGKNQGVPGRYLARGRPGDTVERPRPGPTRRGLRGDNRGPADPASLGPRPTRSPPLQLRQVQTPLVAVVLRPRHVNLGGRGGAVRVGFVVGGRVRRVRRLRGLVGHPRHETTTNPEGQTSGYVRISSFAT